MCNLLHMTKTLKTRCCSGYVTKLTISQPISGQNMAIYWYTFSQLIVEYPQSVKIIKNAISRSNCLCNNKKITKSTIT